MEKDPFLWCQTAKHNFTALLWPLIATIDSQTCVTSLSPWCMIMLAPSLAKGHDDHPMIWWSGWWLMIQKHHSLTSSHKNHYSERHMLEVGSWKGSLMALALVNWHVTVSHHALRLSQRTRSSIKMSRCICKALPLTSSGARHPLYGHVDGTGIGPGHIALVWAILASGTSSESLLAWHGQRSAHWLMQLASSAKSPWQWPQLTKTKTNVFQMIHAVHAELNSGQWSTVRLQVTGTNKWHATCSTADCSRGESNKLKIPRTLCPEPWTSSENLQYFAPTSVRLSAHRPKRMNLW